LSAFRAEGTFPASSHLRRIGLDCRLRQALMNLVARSGSPNCLFASAADVKGRLRSF
jgi:hypothetical protein